MMELQSRYAFVISASLAGSALESNYLFFEFTSTSHHSIMLA